MQIVVVTGLSGAGKSTALRALEDIEFTCVDNIPITLLGALVEQQAHVDVDKLAVAVDSRQWRYLSDWQTKVAELRGAGHRIEVLYLDATDESLLRRFSQTRRRHPLSGADVSEGIRRDREVLRDLRVGANIVETSALTVHQLKAIIQDRYGRERKLATTLVSFGFKHGLPVEFNLVFDVRFLPNPFFEPALTHLDGRDPEVARYVMASPAADQLLDQLEQLIRFTLPQFENEGKLYVTIAIGCTGGRHRSVSVVEELRRRLGSQWDILVRHRDVGRGE